MEITQDDLSDGAIEALLSQHIERMHQYSPPGSVHALAPAKLRDLALTFWSLRYDGQLAGCGALKALGDTPDNAAMTAGEIKSMKTADAFLRRGVAEKLLLHIIEEAQRRAYTVLNLETGVHQAFDPAVALYQKHGFVECGPFADYALDPYSRFYCKVLG